MSIYFTICDIMIEADNEQAAARKLTELIKEENLKINYLTKIQD